MKVRELYEQKGNTSVSGVLNTIRGIYQGSRLHTSPALCHFHTAKNIDPSSPNDTIVLYGYGTTVMHSGLVHNGELLSHYSGTTSTQRLPSGNLRVVVNGNEEEMEPVYIISVGEFLTNLGDQ